MNWRKAFIDKIICSDWRENRYYLYLNNGGKVMRRLLFAIAVLLVLVSATNTQEPAFVPTVLPEMIEISFDGSLYQDASAYVSGIVISTGAAAGNHVYHARRGSIIHFEGQLGTPYETEKVEWLLDTGLLLSGDHKFYMRFQFGVEEPISSGQYITSPMSDASEVVKLIGRPGKPRRDS